MRPAASLEPSDRSIFEAKLQPRTETFIIFVGRIAVAVLVPSHGGDREVTVQQIFRLDIAAPYPLGLIACAALIGLSPGTPGISSDVCRLGKECVSTCRSRWALFNSK